MIAIKTSQSLAKTCDRCGCSSCVVDGHDENLVWCDDCGLMGYIIQHGGTGETIEEQIDIDWIDPCTGESWRN